MKCIKSQIKRDWTKENDFIRLLKTVSQDTDSYSEQILGIEFPALSKSWFREPMKRASYL